MQGNNIFPMVFVTPEGYYYQQMVYWPPAQTQQALETQDLSSKGEEDGNQNTVSEGKETSAAKAKAAPAVQKAHGKCQPKNQNPQRNVLTNISSQLFTFLLNKRKSARILNFLKPDRTEEWQRDFYHFVKKVRSRFSGYYNFQKMKLMWFGRASNQGNSEEYQVLRIISQFYIRHKLISSLLTSKKMSGELKEAHLKARRVLMRLLRDPETELPYSRITD